MKRGNIVKINDLEMEAKDAIIQCVQEIPFLDDTIFSPVTKQNESRSGLRIDMKLINEDRCIIAEVKNNGEPRYARQAVNQILRYLRESQSDYGVFIAPYISPRAAAICQEEGIGYVDLAGNCHISFEKIYIHKEGKQNPYTRKRYLRSLFSPKAERILRVLLTSSLKEWKVEELANEANVSFGQVSNVKKLLADQEWIDSKAIGFSLSDPKSLLEEWSHNYKYKRNMILNFYTLLSPSEFESSLHEVSQQENIRYGLTSFSGSFRYAPAVRHQRVMAYVQGEVDILTARLEMKHVDSGANVLLLRPYDAGVFYGLQLLEDSMVVSPVQIYLDLQSSRGRGEEAADILLERVIRKTW
jgi:hypothetical protein